MRVLVPAADLRAVLGSRWRLEQRLAAGSTEAMALLQCLQAGGSTLAEVLSSSFVSVDAEAAQGGRVNLRHRRAVSVVDALTVDGNRVQLAQHHPRQVVAVAVYELSVNGVSAVRRSA